MSHENERRLPSHASWRYKIGQSPISPVPCKARSLNRGSSTESLNTPIGCLLFSFNEMPWTPRIAIQPIPPSLHSDHIIRRKIFDGLRPNADVIRHSLPRYLTDRDTTRPPMRNLTNGSISLNVSSFTSGKNPRSPAIVSTTGREFSYKASRWQISLQALHLIRVRRSHSPFQVSEHGVWTPIGEARAGYAACENQ